MFSCEANYFKALKLLLLKLSVYAIFFAPSLICSINDRMSLWANQQVVLVVLKLKGKNSQVKENRSVI